MYYERPPKESLDWPLGLVIDVCEQIGLGKPNVTCVRWEPGEISNIIAASQIRHWYENPPRSIKASRVLRDYRDLVIKDEPYAYEWAHVIKTAAGRAGNRHNARTDLFGITEFKPTPKYEDISDRLKSLKKLYRRDIEGNRSIPDHLATWFQVDNPALWSAFIRGVMAMGVLAGVSFIYFGHTIYQMGLFDGAKSKELPLSERFGKTFQNIQLCTDREFEYKPNNTCLSNSRVFTTKDKKINLSFSTKVFIPPGTPFKLQWLRNGELQLEKERPWLLAFAFNLRDASTHVKMQKFDALPSTWADPGIYHIRFFVDNVLVEEMRFDVIQETEIGSNL